MRLRVRQGRRAVRRGTPRGSDRLKTARRAGGPATAALSAPPSRLPRRTSAIGGRSSIVTSRVRAAPSAAGTSIRPGASASYCAAGRPRRSPAPITARAIAPSSRSGWWRLRRTPRSTWASASRPRARSASISIGDLHPVADREGQPLQQLPAPRGLAGERLDEAAELRGDHAEQRAARPARSRARPRPASSAPPAWSGRRNAPLTSAISGSTTSGAIRPSANARVELAGVGVDVRHHLARGGRQRAPHRVALAAARPELREDLRLLHHPRPVGARRSPPSRRGRRRR